MKERKRLELLENLKEMGGPFTKDEDVGRFCTIVEVEAIEAKDAKAAGKIQKD